MNHKIGSKLGNLARVLAVMVMVGLLLAGAITTSSPAFADIAGAPDYYKLDYQVSASGMDAVELWDSVGGTVTSTSSSFIVANDYPEEIYDADSGVIFSSIAVPDASEAQILSAYIAIYSDEESRDFVAYLYGEDTPNAEAYADSESASVSIRNRTGTNRYIDIDTIGGNWSYIDVTPIVEELIASPNWSQGNNMSFLFIHDDAYSYLGDEAYEGAGGSYETLAGTAPKLTIYYAPISENHYVIPFGHGGTIDAGITTNWSGGDCTNYHAINAQSNDFYFLQFQYYPQTNYVETENAYEDVLGWRVYRTIFGFDTSILPDDEPITGASLFMNAYASRGDNTSVVVTKYTFEEAMSHQMEDGSPVFNRSYFVGNLGEYDTREFPQIEGPYILPSRTSIVLKTTLSGVNSYINKTGSTLFGLRDINDINDVCPDGMSGSMVWFSLIPQYWYLMNQGDWINEPPSPSWLTVDTNGEPPVTPTPTPVPAGSGLVSPEVSIMMEIIVLLFITGTIIGLVLVIAKNEDMPVTGKVGVIATIVAMVVVGVIIIESLIVVFK